MGMGLHNPLPSSLSSECKKCGKILASFIDPRQSFGPDKVIPPSILAGAKGLAILTVIKAGFLGSARFGSGLVVARLPEGGWSAPSAIATGGAGFGGQIGFELTDFVFILNDASAVKTFAQAGSLTLGGNVSIAAGPVGRNAEAAGAASLRSVSGIFSYSKTKGLFAGVSLEGSVIVERKDANTKLYGRPVAARDLLAGAEQPPPSAAPLLNILNSRAFSANGVIGDANMYNDVPVYDDHRDELVWGDQNNNQSRAGGEGLSRSNTVNNGSSRSPNKSSGGWGAGAGSGNYEPIGRTKRASTWQDPVYDSPTVGGSMNNGSSQGAPGRPAAPKPNFKSKEALLRRNEATALFDFEAAEPGDLGFKKGEIITVLKKTDSDNDWWTGMVGTRHGIFPSNYVKMVEA